MLGSDLDLAGPAVAVRVKAIDAASMRNPHTSAARGQQQDFTCGGGGFAAFESGALSRHF